MTKEATKKSKFKHFLFGPIRILKKARQLYMKSIVECAGGYGVGAANPAVHHIPHLPKTNGINLNRSRTSGDEGQRELSRPEQIRNVGNETRLVMHRQRQPVVGYTYNGMKMSYNTHEGRKMGKIDEDQPCSFEGDQMGFKTHLLHLYPRRSSVVSMRPVYNQ